MTDNAWSTPETDVDLLRSELDACRSLLSAQAETIRRLEAHQEPPDGSAVGEAYRLVHGARQAGYGHPGDDFTRTGRMWAPLLERWAEDTSEPVPPEVVALCLVAVKMSRECHVHKRDNLVDGAGYFECADLIWKRRAAPEPS